MGRAPCCEKNGLKKGPWTPEEDQKLIDYIEKHGQGNWRTLPKNAGLARCGKSCRLRWTNYLRPDIKRGRFSFEEEQTIIQLHTTLGNRWSAIAAQLPGRTDNEIKNYWNTNIRKRLLRMGIDPVTHSPRLDLLHISSLLNQSLYNPMQFHVSRSLLGIKPLLNSQLLKIASNLLSSECQNPNFLQQNTQQPPLPESQFQDQLQSFHVSQLQNQVQEIPACTAPSSTQFLSDAQLIQANHGLFSYPNLDPSIPSLVQEDPSLDELNNLNSNSNFTTLLSTPESSPTHFNSSSTCINSSIKEESDRFSSDMFKFQIPELFDISEFM